MQRDEISRLCENEVLDTAARLFRTKKESLKVFDSYEGCANLVYAYRCGDQPYILRVFAIAVGAWGNWSKKTTAQHWNARRAHPTADSCSAAGPRRTADASVARPTPARALPFLHVRRGRARSQACTPGVAPGQFPANITL